MKIEDQLSSVEALKAGRGRRPRKWVGRDERVLQWEETRPREVSVNDGGGSSGTWDDSCESETRLERRLMDLELSKAFQQQGCRKLLTAQVRH